MDHASKKRRNINDASKRKVKRASREPQRSAQHDTASAAGLAGERTRE